MATTGIINLGRTRGPHNFQSNNNMEETTSTTPLSSSRSRQPKSGSSGQRSGRPSSSSKKKKKNEISVVTTILGARRQREEDEEDEEEESGEEQEEQHAPSHHTSRIAHKTSSASVTTSAKDKSQGVQLLRPPSDSRDATVAAVNILDARFELARDLGSVEKTLVQSNTVFRVVGAIGSSNSGRSSTLMAVNTTTKAVTEMYFSSKSNGLDIFVNAQRRIILVDFPPVCTPSNKRTIDPPVFATQYRDVVRLYDLRMAFTAMVTCGVLFLCVTDEADEKEPIFQLIKAAATIVQRRGWPCAKVILVRNLVEPGQSNNLRRIQADERTLQGALGPSADVAFGGVLHVPRRSSTSDKESLAVDRELARQALSSFANRGARVPVPSKVLTRATETEWLSSLVYVINETRTHPFFVAGEDTKWLR